MISKELERKLLFEKKAFYQQEYFVGKLFNENYSLENLQVFVEFSLIQPSGIIGYIIGNRNKADKLEKLFGTEFGHLTFESYDMGENDPIAISKKLILRSISKNSYPSNIHQHVNYIIGHIEFFEFKRFMHFKSANDENKSICFYLDTEPISLGISPIMTKHLDGTIESRRTKEKLDIPEFEQYEINACLRYKYDNGESLILENRVAIPAIEIELPKEEKMSKEDFFEKSIDIVNDVLTLYSFINVKDIGWYLYNYFDGSNYEINVNAFIDKEKRVPTDIYRNDLIDPGKKTKFIEKTITKYRNLRDEGLNLRHPIKLLNTGKNEKILNDQFTFIFLGIEKILDYHRKKMKMNNILKKRDFNTLKGDIKNCIEDFFENENLKKLYLETVNLDLKQMVLKKIPELNRPPIKGLLFNILKDLGIDRNDLYPEGAKFTLVATRNQLFHSSEEPEISVLQKDTIRARVILENLILKLLDWNEYCLSPDTYEQLFLTKNS